MKDDRINIVTFGKPDGYKDVHIGHLAGGALFADLYCRCMRYRYPEQKTYLVSGTDGYGMMAYVSCWQSINRKPNNEELRSFVKDHHIRQKTTFDNYRIELDYYGNDTDVENSKEIKRICDIVFERLLKIGLCELKEETEYVDDVYDVAISKYNVIKDNNSDKMFSKLSGGTVSVRNRTNWFLNLEAAREIIEKSKEMYSDNDVKAYIDHQLKSNLPFFRITNSQPWALPMADCSERGDRKYQVWFASLLEPIVYTNKICQRFQTEDMKEIHYDQFVSEDTIFYYAIVRPILWDVLGYKNVNLVYFKYRRFVGIKGKELFYTGDCIAKEYGYDVLRLFFLLRGKNPTIYHLETEEFNRIFRMFERLREALSRVRHNGYNKKCIHKDKSENSFSICSEYICEHRYRKAADSFEYMIMNNKLERVPLEEISCYLPWIHI